MAVRIRRLDHVGRADQHAGAPRNFVRVPAASAAASGTESRACDLHLGGVRVRIFGGGVLCVCVRAVLEKRRNSRRRRCSGGKLYLRGSRPAIISDRVGSFKEWKTHVKTGSCLFLQRVEQAL